MRVVSGVIAWACLCVATLTAAHDVSRRDTSGGSKRVVCYYTNWSVYRPGTAKFNPQNINPYLCTHLIYAFGGLTRENGLRPYDKYQDIEQGGYAKFTGLKTYNKQLKTMLAIGGWNEGSTRFSPLVASVERRGEFVKNVVRFLRQNHFDGLDLDWEYPAFRDGGKARDRDNYALLVQELREEFNRESSKTGRPRLLLTMAVPAGIEYIDKGYDIPKLNKYLDFMNILSYDYHSSFEPSVNHHSPLYPLEEEGEYNFDAQLSIDYTINHYLKLGADRDKLVLGIPTYGRSYTLFNPLATEIGAPADGPGEQGDATREKGYLAYYEICENLQNSDEWKVEKPNPKAMGPYAYKDNQWVGYDDEDIVRKKARYVTEMGLGGIMYWAIDNDDFRGKCHGRPYPLIEAGKEAMLEGSGTSNELVSTVGKGKARPRARVTTEDTPVRNSGGGVARKPSTKRRRPSSKPRAQEKRTSTTSTSTSTTPAYVYPAATPEPPTTPDPGSDFKCEDEGFFPHPRDCKKYFWCLDSGPSNLGIVAHQFTCPSGLFFNKAADSCDYTRNVVCNKKTKETPTTTSTTPAPKTTSTTLRTLRTTTTTTTTEAPEYEEEYEEYEDEPDQPEEDPKAIKELIDLIKKLGGIENLEKQLHLDDSGKSKSNSVTPPAIISKKLYDRVLSQANSRANSNANFYNPSSKTATTQHTLIYRNRGRQNEGLDHLDEVTSLRHEKPQYVTITRNRPTTPTPEDAEDEEDDSEDNVDEVEEEKPRERAYVNIRRDRPTKVTEEATTTPKYVTLRRTRPSAKPEIDDVTDAPVVVSQNTRTSSAALVQELTPTVPKKKYNFAPRTPKRGILPESKEADETEVVTVANEKEENTQEIVKVTTEDQKPEVSGSNQKKYVEIARGRGSATVAPTEAELTTVNIPSEPSSSPVDADVTNPYLSPSTVTDETLNDKTDILPVQTILPTTTTAEPTSSAESVTKKSRFFNKSSTSSTQTTTTEGDEILATETPVSTSSASPSTTSATRGSIKRNRFFSPSSSVSRPTTEVADSLTLDNSTSAAPEDLSTPTVEVKRNRFFRPSANKTQTIGGKIDSFTTNSSTPSSEEVTKRNRFFRPTSNKTQLSGAAVNSLPVNNITSKQSDVPTSSPDDVTKRSRFYRPSLSLKQRTEDNIDPLSIESLFSSSTSSESLSSSPNTQLLDEENESVSNNDIPLDSSQTITVSTTTPFTPTVTRVVTSVTESGTTERQRISLSKYKGFYLTVDPPASSTPPPYVETAYQVATEHTTTASGVLFANLTDKMEKIMEVNRIKQVTFTDDVTLPYTKSISNETTVRPTQQIKSEKKEDKVKEITRLSHITVVDGEEVTSPTLFDTDLNSTASVSSADDANSTNPDNQKEDQTNEISQNKQIEQDTSQSTEPSVTTPRTLNRGRTRVRVRVSTTRAPIPNGLRTSLQRRRTTTLRPGVDGPTEDVDDSSSGRKAFVPRGRGVYRPISRTNKDGETRSSTESQDNERKKFRPRARNDEQNSSSDADIEGGIVPLYKSRVRNKPIVTGRTDEYPQEEQTTYQDDTRTSTDFGEEDSETHSNENTDSGDDTRYTTDRRISPQYKNRSRSKQVTGNPDSSELEKDSKSSTRSSEETARLFPKLRTTQKTDKSTPDQEFKSVTRSQDETAKLFPRLRTTQKTEDIEDQGFKSVTRSQEETGKLFPRLRTTQKTEEDIEDPGVKSVTRSQEETGKLFPRLRTTQKTEEDIEDPGVKSVTQSQDETAKLFPRLRTTQKAEEDIEDLGFKSVTRSQEETAKLFPRLRTTQKTDEDVEDPEFKSVTRSQEETAKLFPRLRTTQKTDEDVDDQEFKSVTRSQDETAKLFPRLRTTQKTDEDVEDPEFKSVTRSQDDTAKLFPRLRTTYQIDDPIKEKEVESHTRSQEDTDKLFPRLRVTDVKPSTSIPPRSGTQARNRSRGQSVFKIPGDVTQETFAVTPRQGQALSEEITREDSSTERKRGRVVKKRRKRPLASSSTATDEDLGVTTAGLATSPTGDLESQSVTFGQKETTNWLYTTDSFSDLTTETLLETQTDSNTVFDDEFKSTPSPSESVLTTLNVDNRPQSVRGRDEVLETQHSSVSLDSSRRGSQKFSLDSSEDEDSNDVTDDPSQSANFFKKYLTKPSGNNLQDNSRDALSGNVNAGAKRRRVIKKKLLPTKSTEQPEDTDPEALQTEVSPPTTRSPLRRPGGSFLANSRLRTRATSTTTSTTTTEASITTKPLRRRGPSPSSRLNIVRRRKFGDNSTTTEQATAERVVASPATLAPREKEVDATTIEPSRKFNFPRRRTKVINRGKVVATTEKTLRPINDSQNEPSTIDDVQTLEPDEHIANDVAVTTPLPDLANVAVVAIHQLAIQPSIRPFKREKSIVGTKATYFAQSVTLPTTPKISTTVVPAYSTTATPFYPRRGTAFYVSTTTAPILPQRESDPFKPRPFSKITAAVHPNSQSGSLEDYEYYDAEGLLDTMPSAGKVKIHGDGYIECLDQGSFPHPFSCKQFISCAKMENGEVLGWEYTCPRHLSYDPIGGICNWSAGLGCKE